MSARRISAAAGSTPRGSATRSSPSAATSTASPGGPAPVPPGRAVELHPARRRSRPCTRRDRRSVYLMTQRIRRHPFLGPLRRRRPEREHGRADVDDRADPGPLLPEQPVRPSSSPTASPAGCWRSGDERPRARRPGLPAGPRAGPRRSRERDQAVALPGRRRAELARDGDGRRPATARRLGQPRARRCSPATNSSTSIDPDADPEDHAMHPAPNPELVAPRACSAPLAGSGSLLWRDPRRAVRGRRVRPARQADPLAPRPPHFAAAGRSG